MINLYINGNRADQPVITSTSTITPTDRTIGDVILSIIHSIGQLFSSLFQRAADHHNTQIEEDSRHPAVVTEDNSSRGAVPNPRLPQDEDLYEGDVLTQQRIDVWFKDKERQEEWESAKLRKKLMSQMNRFSP